MTMPSRSPSACAHSRHKLAGRRAGRQRRVVETIAQTRRASDRDGRETPSDGSPSPRPIPRYIALCPAAQTQRTMCFGSSTPASTAGTKSASSTQLAAASNTSGATFRHFQIFDHHHSDEYVPPIGARYSGACVLRHGGDRGRFVGAGVVLPQPRLRGEVVFEIADRARAAAPWRRSAAASSPSCRRRCRSRDRARSPGRCAASASAPVTDVAAAPDVVGRILPRQVRIRRMQQHALVAARIVEDARPERCGRRRTTRRSRAHRVGADSRCRS